MTPEQNDNLDKWVAKLRTDKFRQGQGAMCQGNPNNGWEYCCLAVLVEAVRPASISHYLDMISIDSEDTTLDDPSQLNETGHYKVVYENCDEGQLNGSYFESLTGFDRERMADFIGWNDDENLPFTEIADRIEEMRKVNAS